MKVTPETTQAINVTNNVTPATSAASIGRNPPTAQPLAALPPLPPLADTLNSELAAFLTLANEAAASGKRPPMYMSTPAQARMDYDAAAPMLDFPPEPDVYTQTISIPTRDQQSIEIRLFTPFELPKVSEDSEDSERSKPSLEDVTSALPVLLYFHGGGYCVGSLDSHVSLCSSLAALASCAVVSVAYRLAPEHRFPTAVYDAEDAYRWIVEHGTAYGLNPECIAVGGDSAGATLATVLALSLRETSLPAPVLQLLLYPCTSPWQDTASHRLFANGYMLEAATLRWMFNNYVRTPEDREDWRFAPLNARDVRGSAPACIILADHDPLLDEGLSYARKLEAAGVPTRLKIYEGMIHDFARLGALIPEADSVRADMSASLTLAFQSKGSSALS